MAYCLPRNLSQKLLKAIGDGSFNIEDYADQKDTAAREAYVSKFVGEADAKDVNTLMESKMLLKDYKKGMVTAVKQLTRLSEKAKTDFVSKINKMENLLSPADEKSFYADITAKKLGADVSTDEAKQITSLTQKAIAAREAPTTQLSGVSDEYLKAADDLRSYIASLKPTSALASIGKNAAIVARNDLLMNPATPIKTSISQLFNSAIDVVTRRIASAKLVGDVSDLASKANKEAWATFRSTGLNTASMENLDDTGKLGEGARFDTPTGIDQSGPVLRGIETVTRKVAQITNKIAIDWEHNYSFTKFYQKTFFDAANILASKLARSSDMSAADIFKDSARIEPKTEEGTQVRNMAQKEAARVTSTNDTWASLLSLGIKDALNGAFNASTSKVGVSIPKVGLGDAIVPIAKIPANIIANGIDNAGLGIPLGTADIVRGLIKMGNAGDDDVLAKQQGLGQFTQGFQRVARTVGVLSAAAYFTSKLSKQDFKTDNYGDQFVKIGGTWVNMEYVSMISPALAGMMTVKKDTKPNQSVLDTGSEYVSGVESGLSSLDFSSGQGIGELITSLKNPSWNKGMGKYLNTFGTSRMYPAFIRSLMSPQPIKGLFFSTEGLPTQQELTKLDAK